MQGKKITQEKLKDYTSKVQDQTSKVNHQTNKVKNPCNLKDQAPMQGKK
jgi:hypothetical protein